MKYTAEDIKIIRGLGVIRKRPQLYFKQKGRDICSYLLEETLKSIVDSTYCCNANKIELSAPKKGGVLIKYDGQGIPIDQETVDGISHPIIYSSIMTLLSNMSGEPNFNRFGHLSEIGGYLAAMSKELTIATLVNGTCYSVSFEYGAIRSVLEKSEIYSSNEIYIVFDKELLEGEDLCSKDLQKLINWGKENSPKVEILKS